MNLLQSVIANVLTALYQPFWFSLLLSCLFMFAWEKYSSLKNAIRDWLQWFRSSSDFKKVFFLVFYTTMILFRTLLNRTMWANPVSNVIGVWGLYSTVNGKTTFTTEVIENIIMFIPFSFLLLLNFYISLIKKFSFFRVLAVSAKLSFLFSLTIEMLQLFLRLGTWQLSDLFYNTLGGILGGLFFYIYRLIVDRQ